jgi:hypothetical protein
LQLAARRAAEAEQARQQADTDRQVAADQVAALAGRWLGRRELVTARERLVLAEHGLRTTTAQADQAAERLVLLRRAQQRHLGWLEANDKELHLRERAVAREDAWRRRVDQHALALDPPGWLLAELGPVPTDPHERKLWRAATAELDGYRRAYGLDFPGPAKLGWGSESRDGRAGAPATPATAEQAGGSRGQLGRRSRAVGVDWRGDPQQRPTVASGRRHQVDRLLGVEPRRQAPGRRRDWQAARAALERLAGWDRHHQDRDQRPRDHRQLDRDRPGRHLNSTGGRQERDGR